MDFLVLARCNHFVGFGVSSFSFFLPQYKALHGFPVAASAHIGGITKEYEMFGRIVDVEQPEEKWSFWSMFSCCCPKNAGRRR